MKLKASKTKMHNLVSEKIDGVPKMKDTEFRAYKGTYWLEYLDVKTDHIMKVCLDKYAGSIHLLVDDRTSKESYIIKLSQEEMISRGMI